ncbi:hypothetical protein B0T17DRAFT_527400 [Bombardia bombarda]|uniref:Uncharacterized protein n=1 Tax=Bombardia bombarda TaxID=252184 RepID=A0AA39XAE9_9PEZI|nr:hypothetical protein B0T17DRAFT_527400 [Bombardia bombarda]
MQIFEAEGLLSQISLKDQTVCQAVSQTNSSVQVDKLEKSLPALPVSRVPSQIRHGAIIPGKTSRGPVARQLPTTIVEEMEPSPEKPKTPVQDTLFQETTVQETTVQEIPIQEMAVQETAVQKTHATRHKDSDVLTVRNKDNSITQAPSKVAKPHHSCKPELPETWKHAISTPSSFEKALDNVVRKLEDMEENKTAAESEQPQYRQHHRGKRSLSKAPSPSQRLQRAAQMRRQRMAGGAAAAVQRNPDMITDRSTSKMETPSIPVSRLAKVSRSESVATIQKPPSKLTSNEEEIPPPSTHADDENIPDRDVLKGLKIICAASADKDLDAWIRSKTGLRLRRFLADLKTFENLSEDGIAAVNDQRARRRRAAAERRKVHQAGEQVDSSRARRRSIAKQLC